MPFGRPLWSLLPGFNILYTYKEEANGTHISPDRRSNEWVCGIGGILFIAMNLLFYGFDISQTGSFNPIEQNRIQYRREEDAKKADEEQVKKYYLLYEKVFGMSGYADTNLDTGISFSERVAAYRKMGYKKAFFENDRFPEPTLEQLEKLVKLYEGDK